MNFSIGHNYSLFTTRGEKQTDYLYIIGIPKSDQEQDILTELYMYMYMQYTMIMVNECIKSMPYNSL